MRMFRNDYSEGAAPEILEALVSTNAEQHVGYTEGDPYCERARELIRAACGRDDVDVEFCIGGTSANIVGVTGMLRDWEGVICTRDGHINVHETGAIAACGRTVLPTRDADGFLSVEEAERVFTFQTGTGRHMTRPAAIYISNTTERGAWAAPSPPPPPTASRWSTSPRARARSTSAARRTACSSARPWSSPIPPSRRRSGIS